MLFLAGILVLPAYPLHTRNEKQKNLRTSESDCLFSRTYIPDPSNPDRKRNIYNPAFIFYGNNVLSIIIMFIYKIPNAV